MIFLLFLFDVCLLGNDRAEGSPKKKCALGNTCLSSLYCLGSRAWNIHFIAIKNDQVVMPRTDVKEWAKAVKDFYAPLRRAMGDVKKAFTERGTRSPSPAPEVTARRPPAALAIVM